MLSDPENAPPKMLNLSLALFASRLPCLLPFVRRWIGEPSSCGVAIELGVTGSLFESPSLDDLEPERPNMLFRVLSFLSPSFYECHINGRLKIGISQSEE